MKIGILLSLAGFVLAAAPALAQDDIGFKPIPSRDIVVPAFSDADVQDLIATLDALVAHEQSPEKWDAQDLVATLDALVAREKAPEKWLASRRIHFWRFSNRLDQGIVSASQEAKIHEYFDALARKHPAHAEYLGSVRAGITARRIGKVAPEIAGKDFDGVEFKLSDYRGKVVVLYFSGDWCGPCRGEYPYQRLMMELYKDQPFAILSVNSDTLDVAKKAKIEKNLTYRSWWDGDQKETTKGPIATAWNVTGWPTIYLLDYKGTIRFVNLRSEDVLKGVKQLMREVPKPPTTAQ
jgi:peroxiredoxin